MTDHDALMRAIVDHPDDDTPRLIFADWLEEHGQPDRAAFVRTLVDLARRPDYDPVAVRARTHDRAAAGGPWAGALPGLPDGVQWAAAPFRRGFPAAVVATDATAFVAHAPDLFARFPVESLAVTALKPAEARPLADSPWLARLVRLEFPRGIGGGLAQQVFSSPHLTRLTELHLGHELTVPSTATALVHSAMFRRLTTLSCRDDNRAGGAVAHALGLFRDRLPLARLDLSGNQLNSAAITPLVRSPALAGVEELDLSGNNLGPTGFLELAGAALPKLRAIHLMRTRPEEDGLRALARSLLFPGLHALSLGGNNLGPWAGPALKYDLGVTDLRVLDLRDNRLGDAGAAALADGPHLARLVKLDLSENGIGDRGAAALAASPHLGELVWLDLHGNEIGEAAADRLRTHFGDRVLV